MSDTTNALGAASATAPSPAAAVAAKGALPASQTTKAAKPATAAATGDSLTLSPQAKALVQKLQARDADVRAHEEAHVAAGGSLVTGGPNFVYEKGPDGREYAVGGDVTIDSSPVKGNPKATEAKELQVEAAALAPVDPSGQDLAVAASAAAAAAQAGAQAAAQGIQGNQGTGNTGGTQGATGAKGQAGAQGTNGQTGTQGTTNPADAAASKAAQAATGGTNKQTGGAVTAPGNGQAKTAAQVFKQAYAAAGTPTGNQARRPGSLVDTLG
jgi:hypothetical protein